MWCIPPRSHCPSGAHLNPMSIPQIPDSIPTPCPSAGASPCRPAPHGLLPTRERGEEVGGHRQGAQLTADPRFAPGPAPPSSELPGPTACPAGWALRGVCCPPVEQARQCTAASHCHRAPQLCMAALHQSHVPQLCTAAMHHSRVPQPFHTHLQLNAVLSGPGSPISWAEQPSWDGNTGCSSQP